ncbi:Uncharacterised protein [Segatella copri]|nr:Uncharacterised protein [Segatella copri]
MSCISILLDLYKTETWDSPCPSHHSKAFALP